VIARGPENGKDKKPHIDRGWGVGQVGWGVQGKFGSNEQDDGTHVSRINLSTIVLLNNQQLS
jgi:hypothetical protein